MRGRSSLLDEVALYSALTLRLISQGPPEPRHGLAGAPGSRTVSDRAESHAIDKDGTVYLTPRFCSALPVSPVRFNLRQQITGSRLRQLPRRLFRQLARPFGGRIRVFRIPGAPNVHAVRTRCSAEPLSFARTPFGKFRSYTFVIGTVQLRCPFAGIYNLSPSRLAGKQIVGSYR